MPTMKRSRESSEASETTVEPFDNLQHQDTQVILDTFEHLRSLGIEDDIPLPRLVVAGDTSSGKSSVLMRITNIVFPSGEGVVTRFATEVAMRPADEHSIKVRILPHSNRKGDERARILRFKPEMHSFSDYPDIHARTTELMSAGCGSSAGLLRDVLRIEVAGPKNAPLTIIDLPGLIHATSATVTQADLELSHKLVEEYMAHPLTIILAVVSATNELENQAITQKARKVDPEGLRTMGIVTKPDAVAGQKKNEQGWMSVVQNKNISLMQGWHALVNKSEDDEDASLDDIQIAETEFFSDERFAKLDSNTLGLENLLERLSCMVYEHVTAALPGIEQQMQHKLKAAKSGLEKLGAARADPQS